MKKENGDEKLISFLRAHKPDVPRKSLNFEEKLLDSTVRRHWRTQFARLFRAKRIYAWATVCIGIILVISFNPSRQEGMQVATPGVNVTHTPTVAYVPIELAEVSDEEALLFLADSLETASSESVGDLFSAFDTL